MNKLSAIIIDDELCSRENLRLIIQKYCPEIEVISTAGSAVEGKQIVEDLQPEVVFLDINMPVLNGFDFLNMVSERDFMLVFVTAYEEYAIEALRLKAVDYILKPIDIRKLEDTVKNLVIAKKQNSVSNSNGFSLKLVIPHTNGFSVIEADTIIRMEGNDCYTKIFIENGKSQTVSKTLKQFYDILCDKNFFRVHKSHIINLKYFKEYSKIDGGHVILSDGTRLEISRRRLKDFLIVVKKFLNK